VASEMTHKHNVGNQGETLAADYLLSKGYHIIERNWHCRFGELDIVAQSGETWVFCEVKTVLSENVEDAFANLTPNKAKKLLKAIYHYLAARDLEDILWRMDAIAVAIPPNAQPLIDHVEDVLDW
jgi:putative endonuclease